MLTQPLHHLVNSVYPLPDEDWLEFESLWKPYSAKRKDVITSAGECEKYLYFVLEGVQRVYYLDDQNREATVVFTYTPSFGGVLNSMMLQQPSKYYYEALTPSSFLRTRYDDVLDLMNRRHSVESFVRVGLSGVLSGLMERLVELQCFSSEEKFRKLLQRSPHILHLVPHKYLANYLGIDATNFSKFINKIKI